MLRNGDLCVEFKAIFMLIRIQGDCVGATKIIIIQSSVRLPAKTFEGSYVFDKSFPAVRFELKTFFGKLCRKLTLMNTCKMTSLDYLLNHKFFDELSHLLLH